MNTAKHYEYKNNLIELYAFFECLANNNLEINHVKKFFCEKFFPKKNNEISSLYKHVAKITGCMKFAEIVDFIHPRCGKELYSQLANDRELNYGIFDSDTVQNNSYRGTLNCENECYIHTLAVDVYAQHLVFLLHPNSDEFPKCYVADKELSSDPYAVIRREHFEECLYFEVIDWQNAPLKALECIKRGNFEFNFGDILE